MEGKNPGIYWNFLTTQMPVRESSSTSHLPPPAPLQHSPLMSHLHFYSTELPDNEANVFALSVQFWTTEISKPYKKTVLPFSV